MDTNNTAGATWRVSNRVQSSGIDRQGHEGPGGFVLSPAGEGTGCEEDGTSSAWETSINLGWLGEVLDDWRKENVPPIFKKKNPGNYRPVNLTSIPGKVMEQLILETISRHK